MLKLTVVRCFNSGILIYLSVPYSDRFKQDALQQIQGILIADAISTPFLRLLDIPGLYNRYISAPKAVTQEEMDLLWSPQNWSLAERYTDTLKTVFVGLMYAVPLPSGLFITAGAMITTYWVDKYSLTRIWKRPPSLDSSLSTLCGFFMMCMLWLHVFFTRNFFSNWPFALSSPPDNIQCGFFLCSISGSDNSTHESRTLTDIYNALNVICFIIVAIWFYNLTFATAVRNYFYDSGYTNDVHEEDFPGATQFRKLSKVSAYVPLVSHVKMNDPILMADISDLPPKHAPVHNTENVFSDIPSDPSVFSVVNTEEFPNKNDMDLRTLFSQVRYYNDAISTGNVYNTMKTASGGGGMNAAGNKVSATKAFHDDQGALPKGWAIKYTQEGKPYYVNHINRTTQWARPMYGNTSESQP